MGTGETGQTDWSDQLAIRPSYTVWSVKVQCPADGTPVTEPTVSSGRRFGSERREGGREGGRTDWMGLAYYSMFSREMGVVDV